MNILAIDSSSSVASAALVTEEKMLAEFTTDFKKNHSERLMPMIDEILRAVELKPNNIDAIAVAIGPGSFTGLRIGLATAKGMAQSLDKKIIGVSSLEAAAYSVPYTAAIVCSVIDALRGEVYAAIYEWSEFKLKEILKPGLYSLEEYIKFILSQERDFIAVNDGAYLLEKELHDNLNYHHVHRVISMPKASIIGLVAAKKAENDEFDNVNTLAPVYMRKSAAEEQYELKLSKKV